MLVVTARPMPDPRRNVAKLHAMPLMSSTRNKRGWGGGATARGGTRRPELQQHCKSPRIWQGTTAVSPVLATKPHHHGHNYKQRPKMRARDHLHLGEVTHTHMRRCLTRVTFPGSQRTSNAAPGTTPATQGLSERASQLHGASPSSSLPLVWTSRRTNADVGLAFSYTQAVSSRWVVRENLGCTLSGFRLQWVAASSMGRRIMARHTRRNRAHTRTVPTSSCQVYLGTTSARAPSATNMVAVQCSRAWVSAAHSVPSRARAVCIPHTASPESRMTMPFRA